MDSVKVNKYKAIGKLVDQLELTVVATAANFAYLAPLHNLICFLQRLGSRNRSTSS